MYRSCINMAVLILTNQKNMTHCIGLPHQSDRHANRYARTDMSAATDGVVRVYV